MTKGLDKQSYTSFEKARLIGARALQLSMGAPMAVKLSEEDLQRIKFSPIEIAKLEYEENKIPIDIKRNVPD